MRHARLKTCGRWALTGLSLLLVAAWLVSARWTVFIMAQFGDTIGLKAGTVFYLWTSPGLRAQQNRSNGVPLTLDWDFYCSRRKTALEWFPGLHYTSAGRSIITVPIWSIGLPLSLVAGALWWSHAHRTRPGHCVCGYDLSGTPAGSACPECGWVRPRAPAPASVNA